MSNSAVATRPKQAPPGAIIPAAQKEQVANLDNIVKSCNRELVEASQAGNEIAKAIIMSKAIPMISDALEPLMDDIMQLMNNPMGFKTDRPPGAKTHDGKPLEPYTRRQVRDVLTVALLKGFRFVLNEINIIAGQFYGTKEGYERLLKDLPGMKNLRIEVGVPTNASDKGAVVDCKASWVYMGTPGSLACEGRYAIPVKMNSGMGTDAAQGKATSKMLRRIYRIVTNMEPDDDTEDANTIEGTAEPVQQKQ